MQHEIENANRSDRALPDTTTYCRSEDSSSRYSKPYKTNDVRDRDEFEIAKDEDQQIIMLINNAGWKDITSNTWRLDTSDCWVTGDTKNRGEKSP